MYKMEYINNPQPGLRSNFWIAIIYVFETKRQYYR